MQFTTKAGTVLPLLDLKGKPYLQVAHRIQWFREEKPDWVLSTSYLVQTDTVSICKAEVFDNEGKLRAMGHKREDAKGFGDHLEKAETGAIGRALAMLGYGTQFTANEFDEGERLADSPIQQGAPVPQKPQHLHANTAGFAGAEAYIIPYGNDKGKCIGELTDKAIVNNIQYWKPKLEADKAAGKKVNPVLSDYVMALEAALDSRTPREQDMPF